MRLPITLIPRMVNIQGSFCLPSISVATSVTPTCNRCTWLEAIHLWWWVSRIKLQTLSGAIQVSKPRHQVIINGPRIRKAKIKTCNIQVAAKSPLWKISKCSSVQVRPHQREPLQFELPLSLPISCHLTEKIVANTTILNLCIDNTRN